MLIFDFFRKEDVFISAKRPGDLYKQLAALASISSYLNRVFYRADSLFFDYRLLDIFSSIDFIEVPNRRGNYVAPHRSTFFLNSGGVFKYSELYDSFKRYSYSFSANYFEGRKAIFLSFESEKRKWLNQLDFLDFIVRRLGSKAVIINSGMTQTINRVCSGYKTDQRLYEENILTSWCKENDCDFVNCFGMSVDEKIPFALSCAYSIGSIGTSNFITNALSIPTLSAGNNYIYDYAVSRGVSGHNKNEVVVTKDYVIEVGVDGRFIDKDYVFSEQLVSYLIDERFFDILSERFCLGS
ncbi:hypothetical protein [Marinospirillum alkaliphilum]|uniref:Uncharacterized protein n=1 Tax=Marinospirillum alkaliphilum DSM 21637 TaxID=1122209 RepID=A0A1K1U7H8_9GAMM|nr:hypothetical protein [Marinospirillum alkaliphilum]SFX08762.1 hypothetical protein SAMN02745752_00488 [Marinospirillum alkaliphilum DSM 21637]